MCTQCAGMAVADQLHMIGGCSALEDSDTNKAADQAVTSSFAFHRHHVLRNMLVVYTTMCRLLILLQLPGFPPDYVVFF